jgi:MFS transporter, CP family, cyanate transporter
VLLPVLVRRDFSGRTATVMALYSTALIGFAALAAGVSVPIADALGGGWKGGLGIWAVPAAVAALLWAPWLLRRDASAVQAAGPGGAHERIPVTALLRRPLAWQVTLFFALQSGGFYATLAWLPSIYESHGASQAHAGLLLSLTMVVGLITAVTVPGLAGRSADQRPLMIACCALTAGGLAGVLLAPMSAPYLWTVLLGLGQNAAFPLALMLIVTRAGNVSYTQALSTMTQSVGYVLGAFAPLAVGAIHGATHSWTPSLILLLVLVVPELVIGLAAARNRVLAPPRPVVAAVEEPQPVVAGR